jgi:pantoate--beta-alanine ligase
VRETVEQHGQVRLEYVSLADPDTLEELTEGRAGALLSLAAHVGRTRLIDNVTLP